MTRSLANLCLSLSLIICCGLELRQAAPVPETEGIPSNAVAYKRWVRRRPSPHDPSLDVYEVRHVYFVRRTTPKPKALPLTDDEMDRRIRCDFDTTLPECQVTSSSTTPRTTTTTSTEASTTVTHTSTEQLPFLPEETTSSTPTPTTTTTSTEAFTTSTTELLPFLPEETSTTEDPSVRVEDPDDEVYTLPPDTDDYDVNNEDAEDNGDYENADDDYSGGSIGASDTTAWTEVNYDPVNL